MTTQEQRWATAELTLDVQAAKRVRRTPAVLIAITGLLVLAVGLTAAVDLRRLQSPRGAATAWTEAAVFGDCRAFLELSAPNDADRRTDDEICQALRAKTATARSEASRTTLETRSVVRRGREAVATIAVHGPDTTTVLTLRLVHRGGRWLVLREVLQCGVVTC